MEAVLDAVLIALTLILAALTLFHPRIFAGVVLFITYGLVLSLVWLRLGAPDVALAEAAIGAGLTGALLIATLSRLAAAARSRPPEPHDGETEEGG
jgi:energy-converting hydrogenase B subunit D